MTVTESTTRTLDVPGATLTYDVRRAERPTSCRCSSSAHRWARRLRHAVRALPRSDDHHLRPARERAEHQAGHDDAVDARRSRRRPASDHPGSRRAGRPVRQQRRRGERAGAGGEAPGGRADARRTRAAARVGPPRPRERAAASRAVYETYMRAAGAPGWPTSSPSSATAASSPTTSRSSPRPTRRCSGCRPRTTARGPIRCSAGLVTGSSLRARRRRPARAPTRIVMAAGNEGEGEMANRGAHAVAERLGTKPVIFPSGHGGFLGGEYGQTGRAGGLRGQAARGPVGGLLG